MRAPGLLLLFAPLLLDAQSLAEFEKRVTEFTLPNGLHFILMERHEAPVISFRTYVNAGSVEDPEGRTGLAHMFEHMAFKGTPSIGTRNWPDEKRVLEEIEKIYDQLEAERARRPKPDLDRISTLEGQLKLAMDRAGSYVITNDYPRIIEENGGVGLNAGTGLDSTEYFCSLPSNRAELWFLLESQRFLHPVFREFYRERDVVMEERRSRVESSPRGKLIDNFQATAFQAFPYHRPTVGYASDIVNLRAKDAEKFFRTWYVPSNITIGIAGDLNPGDARRLAEKYFGPLPATPPPLPVHTVEPKQDGPKLVEVESPSQPVEAIGYKRPDQYDKDDPVFDVISGILSGGRTGILHRDMIRDKRISLVASAIATFPDGRHENLFVFFLVPAPGHTVAENEKELEQVLEKFKTEKVDAVTLARVKTKTRASLIRTLDSNSGMAQLLTSYHANYGDWRKLFTSLADMDKVTADDVQRVAKQYFVPTSRTIAYTYQPRAARHP